MLGLNGSKGSDSLQIGKSKAHCLKVQQRKKRFWDVFKKSRKFSISANFDHFTWRKCLLQIAWSWFWANFGYTKQFEFLCFSHMTKDFLANVMVQRIKAPKRNKKPMKTLREKVYEIRIRFSIIWKRCWFGKFQIFARNESSRKWMNYSAEIWYPCLQLTSDK